MLLPEWVTILSFVASCVSIFLGWFAVKQANESARRAEELNKQTQDTLLSISVCTAKIETIVKEQQSRQLDIIATANKKLVEFITQNTDYSTNISKKRLQKNNNDDY
ncbi:hypothetical protein II906_10180 [bacterium]|nr:hypothetical protein [bacterium]